jgi:O-antigen ligase
MVVLYLLRSKHKFRAFATIGAIVLLIAPILSDAYWDRMSSIRLPGAEEDLTNQTEGDDASMMGRLHFWSMAVDMAQHRPVTGVGHNSYVAAYDDYDTMNGAYGHRRSVHSSWLGLLAEVGFPGLAIFMVIFVLSLMTSRRIRKLARSDPGFEDLVPFAVAIETGLVVFAVGGAFVIFQYTEILWHFLGLSAAISRIASARVRARETELASTRVTAPTALPAAGVA